MYLENVVFLLLCSCWSESCKLVYCKKTLMWKGSRGSFMYGVTHSFYSSINIS